MLIHSAEITGSVQFNDVDVSNITNVSGFATTASVDALVVKTGSYASTSSVNELQSKTGSYTTTSSFGTYTASNDLTNATQSTRLSTIESVTGSFTSTSSFDAYSSSINTFTSSATTRLNTIESVTGSFASTSSVNNLQSVTGSYASTGSNQFNGNQSISGSITLNGTITAQTLVVQTVTSSIEFVTGSTRNGSLAENTHQFTGSVLMTGSLSVVTTGTELQVNASGVNIGNALTDNHVISGSVRINPNGLFISSSGDVGIGTLSPSGKLHVTDYIIGTCTTSFNGDGMRVYASATGGPGSQPGIGFWTAAGSKRFITQLDVSSDTWMVVNATGTSHVIVTQSGSVGIGTTAPLTKLDIRGTSTSAGATLQIVGNGISTLLLGQNSRGGVIRGQGGSDELSFWTGGSGDIGAASSGTERMRISSTGVVTKPYQPAFKVGRSSAISVGSNSTIVFNDTSGNHFNTGGHYSTSTGMFTAPVAGKYVFSALIIYQEMSAGQLMDDAFYIYKNGDLVTYSFRRAEYEAGYTGNGGYYTDHANILLDLAVNDTVSVRNNRALTIHGNTQYTWFYGYMLG